MSGLGRLPRAAALAALLVTGLPAVPPASAADPSALPPEIRGEFIVEGRWRMTGDVVVQSTGSLRLRPGATLEISAEDATRSGMSSTLCELHVFGRLEAEGTADRPVLLSAAASAAESAEWGGVSLRPPSADARPSFLRHVRIRGAREGVYVGSGTPRIERCVFERCGVGVAAGQLVDSAGKEHEPRGDADPDVVECLFLGCKAGVGVDGRATPSIVRSTFADGECGVGNRRNWWITHSVASLGARIDRCLFLRNEVGVHGGAVVENSVFLRNGAVLAMSQFHDPYSASVDRVAWRRNVLWANTVLVDGEADLGSDNRVEDPRLRSEPDAATLAAATPPVRGLDLLPGSPCRGTALDGGDLGPAGDGPRGRRLRRWGSAGRAVGRVLVLGPPERLQTRSLPKAAPSGAGDRFGEAWWVALDADAGGAIDRAAIGGGDDATVLPLAWIWRSGGGAAAVEVEVNADGDVALWRGESSLPFPQSPQRHGSRGVRVAAGPLTGPPGVVAWWRTSEPTSRIGAALHAADGAAIPLPDPPADPPSLTLEPIVFGPRHAGLRVRPLFHWADVRRSLSVRLRAADGSETDVSGSLVVHDAKGTLRCDVPAGFEKVGAVFVVEGLRDVWGRPFTGQPATVPAVPD